MPSVTWSLFPAHLGVGASPQWSEVVQPRWVENVPGSRVRVCVFRNWARNYLLKKWEKGGVCVLQSLMVILTGRTEAWTWNFFKSSCRKICRASLAAFRPSYRKGKGSTTPRCGKFCWNRLSYGWFFLPCVINVSKSLKIWYWIFDFI